MQESHHQQIVTVKNIISSRKDTIQSRVNVYEVSRNSCYITVQLYTATMVRLSLKRTIVALIAEQQAVLS